MNESGLVPHLFKTEYSKMVSVLAKSFGLEYIETAEDIVSETFLSALSHWPYKGIPENPTAWLYAVAKNKLINALAREGVFKRKLAKLSRENAAFPEIVNHFSENHISDCQLQMLFAICHPSISAEAQICLALRILCGLGLTEIADAFLSNSAAIHKRLQRAKEKLRAGKIKLEIPNEREINKRLDTVLQTIYLLFSEGYYSESNPSIVRKELCEEAMHLAYLLLGNALTNQHATNALMSLMCFQASRLEARQSADGIMVQYDQQDRTKWDTRLMEKGFCYLQQAAQWEISSTYYLEASIAYWHTVDNSLPDKWHNILKWYDVLLMANPSPIVALNRLWAYSKVHGNVSAIEAAETLDLHQHHLFHILLAALYKPVDIERTAAHLAQALHLCRNNTEKAMIRKQLSELDDKTTQ